MRIEDLSEKDIGARVTYTPFEGCDPDQLEYGVITSFNDTNVFVRYGSNTGSQATRPEDLKRG